MKEVLDVWDGKILCTRDLKRCEDGSFVSRFEPTCEFRACPVITGEVVCNQDVKRCSDGTSVKRVGPSCEFEQCGLVKPTDTGEQRCDTLWNGFKFDSDKGICIDTSIRGCENTLYESFQECNLDNEVQRQVVQEDNFTDCSLEFIPVCGDINGIQSTYTNNCLMEQEGAILVGEGTCSQVNSIYTKVINWILSFFN